jgi:hypothetical protein
LFENKTCCLISLTLYNRILKCPEIFALRRSDCILFNEMQRRGKVQRKKACPIMEVGCVSATQSALLQHAFIQILFSGVHNHASTQICKIIDEPRESDACQLKKCNRERSCLRHSALEIRTLRERENTHSRRASAAAKTTLVRRERER